MADVSVLTPKPSGSPGGGMSSLYAAAEGDSSAHFRAIQDLETRRKAATNERFGFEFQAAVEELAREQRQQAAAPAQATMAADAPAPESAVPKLPAGSAEPLLSPPKWAAKQYPDLARQRRLPKAVQLRLTQEYATYLDNRKSARAGDQQRFENEMGLATLEERRAARRPAKGEGAEEARTLEHAALRAIMAGKEDAPEVKAFWQSKGIKGKAADDATEQLKNTVAQWRMAYASGKLPKDRVPTAEELRAAIGAAEEKPEEDKGLVTPGAMSTYVVGKQEGELGLAQGQGGLSERVATHPGGKVAGWYEEATRAKGMRSTLTGDQYKRLTRHLSAIAPTPEGIVKALDAGELDDLAASQGTDPRQLAEMMLQTLIEQAR